MTDIAHILGEFIAAWNAGQRPRLAAYLERAAPAERDDLADQIETFLMLAPEPAYSEDTWREMTADPVVARAAEASFAPAEPWPSLLPRLRDRAGLTWSEVASGLAQRLGFEGREDKAEDYLADMEAGQLEPRRVSWRLLDSLAELLGVTAAALDWRAPAAPAVFRADAAAAPPAQERLEIIADAMMSAPAPFDDVDELFLGGRGEPE